MAILNVKTLTEKFHHGSNPLQFIYHRPQKESDFSRKLYNLLTGLTQEADGAIQISMDDSSQSPLQPGFTLSFSGRKNIHYHALPEGPEEAPFLEAVAGFLTGHQNQDNQMNDLKEIDQEIEITVFISPVCPFCPQVVKIANFLASKNPVIHVRIVDIMEFPALAEKFNIQSVPVTMIDQGLSMVGLFEKSELIKHLISRGSDAYQKETILSWLEARRTDDLVAELQRGRSLRQFADIWLSSTTFQRLGLVVAAEDALEKDRAIFDSIVTRLYAALKADDAALRGDTADLLGMIGKKDSNKYLEGLLNDDNPDVREIAAEAMERLHR
jgi:thiol-disulfide isomerase/thioredoxin